MERQNTGMHIKSVPLYMRILTGKATAILNAEANGQLFQEREPAATKPKNPEINGGLSGISGQ